MTVQNPSSRNNDHTEKSGKVPRKRLPFPLPGQRIVRSVLALWCCLAVYYLRGRRGAPFYSMIAALQCVQPYTENILQAGKKRIIGTLVGAFWGTIVLFSELRIVGGQFEENVFHYLMLGLFSGIVLYSTVLLNLRESAYFSTVVFLSIAMNHIDDVNPGLYVFNRSLDTIIGVGVAILICALHFPRLRDRETLFVSGVDHVLFRKDRRLSDFTKVELNRFLQDGILFSVSTKQTPATVRELLAGVNLRLPIIAMDGVVLYDMNSRKYLITKKMEPDLAGLVTAFLHGEGMPFFVNNVEEDLLVIYFRAHDWRYTYRGNAAPDPEEAAISVSALDAMDRLYLKKNVSPYRNYVRVDHDVTDNVLYLLVIDKKERVRALYDTLLLQPWADRCRCAFDTFDCGEGEEILRIYAAGATREAMLENLREYVGADRTVTFGNTPGACDVLIPESGGEVFIKELKKRFEPFNLRGWKNMLRL